MGHHIEMELVVGLRWHCRSDSPSRMMNGCKVSPAQLDDGDMALTDLRHMADDGCVMACLPQSRDGLVPASRLHAEQQAARRLGVSQQQQRDVVDRRGIQPLLYPGQI